jgi:hypothetical protein
MGFFDLQIPFFLPMWRRILLVAVCFAWGIFEFLAASPSWGVFFGALGGFALWKLFLSEWPETADQTDNGND